ncbi:LysR substrate-binding domain-containing protein [Pacificispira sp.]|uniref:LysR substrate-binding domain-containing protein n=1 Tax=Pacificispira sp. TaxID=2888761 RepID=UPI003BAC8AA6
METLPPLRLLTTFETVLRTGGVQNAAAELNVTQPAVSQALKALEDHVGATLLDRRRRPAELTEAGRVLSRAVAEGMGQMRDAVSQIRLLQRAEVNRVTIACTVCTGTYWLMPRLAEFYDLHPNVSVHVETTPATPHFAPDTDLVMRYGPGHWTDGVGDLLFPERLVPVCSPDAYDRFGRGDFAQATLLHVEVDDADWPGWSDYFGHTGLAPAHKADRVVGGYVQATQAAIAGIGVMLGWVSNASDLLAQGRLIVFRDAPLYPNAGFHILRPKTGRRKRAAGLLYDFLLKSARQAAEAGSPQ